MSNSPAFNKLRDAIRHELINYENPNGKSGKRVHRGQAMAKLARRLIHMAINGNERDSLAAIKELGDRLDGKAVQAIATPDGEPITVVERVIVQQAAGQPEEVRPLVIDQPVKH